MPDLSPDHTQHSSTAKAHKPSPPDTLHPVETVCIHFDTFDNSPCSNSSLFVFHLSYVTDEKKVIDVESITLPLHILLSFLFSVFMCKQMLLAVFIIALAFRTKTELQILPILPAFNILRRKSIPLAAHHKDCKVQK